VAVLLFCLARLKIVGCEVCVWECVWAAFWKYEGRTSLGEAKL